MYVRDAKNREEVWLLDHIEAMGLDERAFRSRDYVIAIDEHSGEKAGFGRLRIHQKEDDDVCELTSIGVLDGWRDQGVGAHIVERLLEYADDTSIEKVFALAPTPDYLAQFGFDPIDDEELPEKLQARLGEKREQHDIVVPMAIEADGFRMPPRLRERFKRAGRRGSSSTEPETEADAVAEELGIDPEKATYKYDPTGGRR